MNIKYFETLGFCLIICENRFPCKRLRGLGEVIPDDIRMEGKTENINVKTLLWGLVQNSQK